MQKLLVEWALNAQLGDRAGYKYVNKWGGRERNTRFVFWWTVADPLLVLISCHPLAYSILWEGQWELQNVCLTRDKISFFLFSIPE